MRLKNVLLYGKEPVTIEICNGKLQNLSPQKEFAPLKGQGGSLHDFINETSKSHNDKDKDYDGEGLTLAPAAIDAHVHSRDPGYTHKEDWESLAASAFQGGVVGVVDMPNTFPPTFHAEDVRQKAAIAAKTDLDFRFLLGAGADNISSMAKTLSQDELPLAGVKIYYGQSTGNLMFSDLDALSQALPTNYQGILVFHSEDQCRIDERQDLLNPSENHGKKGPDFRVHSQIRDSESAWVSTRKILNWAENCGFRVHLAHASTPEEIVWVDKSRQAGGLLSSEVSPHHLMLSTEDYDHLGPLAKVNPPVRAPEEVSRLRGLVARGLVECFATDHAPHTLEEKNQPYASCPSGIPSLEFYWPLFGLAAKSMNKSPWELLPMVGKNPARLFNFPDLGCLEPGKSASFVLLEERSWHLRQENIKAKCGWSPFREKEMPLRVVGTWHRGQCKYADF